MLFGLKILFPFFSLNAWWWIEQYSIFLDFRSYFIYGGIILLSFYAFSSFFVVFALIYRKLQKSMCYNVLIFPVVWIILERGRELISARFSWGHLGYAWHDNISLLQIASIGGVYGLSFLVVLVNILLFHGVKEIIQYKHDRKGSILKNALPFCIVVIIMSASFLFGCIVVSDQQPNYDLPVAVIHSVLRTEESVGVSALLFYKGQIRDAAQKGARLIILPENAIPFFVINENTKRPHGYDNLRLDIKKLYDSFLATLSEFPDVSVLIGLHTYKDGGKYNSVVVFDGGDITAIYNKIFLIPFTEDPRGILENSHVDPLARGNKDQNMLFVQNVTITPLICSEISLTNIRVAEIRPVIANVSNDSIFSSPSGGIQHHVMAKIQAVKNRAYVLRSVKGGISSIIDPFGRVLRMARDNETSILFMNI